MAYRATIGPNRTAIHVLASASISPVIRHDTFLRTCNEHSDMAQPVGQKFRNTKRTKLAKTGALRELTDGTGLDDRNTNNANRSVTSNDGLSVLRSANRDISSEDKDVSADDKPPAAEQI